MARIILDARKSLHENAAHYFEEAKKARERRQAVEKAVGEVKAKIAALQSAGANAPKAPALVEKIPSVRQWFERFNWFKTSGGRLCVAGKDAKQNEVLVAHYFQEGDLFFHADVQGAAVSILKEGAGASEEEMREAAQFAACFSKAWKAGFVSVDVYAVGRRQVSKTPESGEFLAKGSFVIRGERKWFKNTALALCVGFDSGGALRAVPRLLAASLEKKVELEPGEKKQLAGKAVKQLGLDKALREQALQLIP